MSFDDLHIIEPIAKALKEKKYSSPTPIQEQAIPLLLERNDLLGCAQTGTGKTAAFAIPILQNLSIDRQKSKVQKVQALVITPTRELAIQISESFTLYGKYTGLVNTAIFGGVKQGPQVSKLKKGVDILVATPGRLLDLIYQGFISLADIKYFVLDEADRMLDMGFVKEIMRIIGMLPTQRQSLFFSATMPKNIQELSSKILTKPKHVKVTPVSSTAETIQQYLYYTNKGDKHHILLHILKEHKIDQVLVFSRTKHGADKIVRSLGRKNISAAAIHGNKGQNHRQKTLAQFKSGEIKVLVATDIAARGIDINKLRFVINYDIPNISETYVHRIGRSGRAGKEGVAISICEAEDNAYLKDIEKLINKKIDVIKKHPYPQTDRPMTQDEKKAHEAEKKRKRNEYFAKKRGGSTKESSKNKNPIHRKYSKNKSSHSNRNHR